jgi:hypothetical protein
MGEMSGFQASSFVGVEPLETSPIGSSVGAIF